jgi:hypothetical protein
MRPIGKLILVFVGIEHLSDVSLDRGRERAMTYTTAKSLLIMNLHYAILAKQGRIFNVDPDVIPFYVCLRILVVCETEKDPTGC